MEKSPQDRAADEGFTQEDYEDACSLIKCLIEVCPRSTLAEDRIDQVGKSILAGVSISPEELTQQAESSQFGYILALASLWRKLIAQGNDYEGVVNRIDSALREAGIDWKQQELERERIPASLSTGSLGVHFQEMILGCGIGDAFGAGVEFWDGEWIQQLVCDRYNVFRGDPVLSMWYKGYIQPQYEGSGQNYMAGMYTDD